MTKNNISASSKHSMLVRCITAILFVGALIPCTVFGGWAYFVLFAFFAIVSFHEVIKAPGPQRYSLLVKIVTYAFCLSFVFWNFAYNWVGHPNPTNGGRFGLNTVYISLMALISYALVLFLIAVLSPKVQLSDVTYLFTVGLLVAMGWLGIYFLRYFPNSTGIVSEPNLVLHPDWANGAPVAASNYFSAYYESLGYSQTLSTGLLVIFIAFGTWGSDVGAYFVGMLFGKHKMNPRISPHKTWEGFFGGMVFAWAIALGFAAVMEFCFNLPLIPGLVQFRYSALLDGMGVLHGQAWPFITFIGVLLPIIGNVGGFLFSLIKRQFGIKDYGKLLPGHGGVIDRFDSMLINSICTSLIILLTTNGWNIFHF